MWQGRHDPTPCTLVGHEHLTLGDLTRQSLRQSLAILKRERDRLETFYDRAIDNIEDEGDTLPPPWERSEA
jgi:hypothetical protein